MTARVPEMRWRERGLRWAPDGPRFEPRRHEVAPIKRGAAKRFVEEHHYSGSFCSESWSFGLFRDGTLAGAAVFGEPQHPAVLTKTFPGSPEDVTQLGRFVLIDGVEKNGESWFLAPCLDALRREGVRGVISFSDPHPRTTLEGELVMPGHVGAIYQASNAVYRGRTRAEPILLLPDGRSIPSRSLNKVKAGDSRWRGVVRSIVRAGVRAPECFYEDGPDVEELREWVDGPVARVVREEKHPGNHRYAFPLTPREKRRMRPNPGTYPKRGAA